MSRNGRTLLCHFDGQGDRSYGWYRVSVSKKARWKDGVWWDGERPVGSGGIRCPGPEGQNLLGQLLRQQRTRDPRRLNLFEARKAFRLDGIGSFAPRKGMVPRSRALPAVDLYEEPRPAPRPGLKLCECGLPVAPGLDMCRRCALLDYGTTSARIIGPGTRPRRQKIHRGAAKRAAIIDILRDRPEGATITEMLQEMGQDPGAHTPRNSLQIFLARWVPETEGRVIKRPCTRKGQRATCYHLDTGFSRRRRQR